MRGGEGRNHSLLQTLRTARTKLQAEAEEFAKEVSVTSRDVIELLVRYSRSTLKILESDCHLVKLSLSIKILDTLGSQALSNLCIIYIFTLHNIHIYLHYYLINISLKPLYKLSGFKIHRRFFF